MTSPGGRPPSLRLRLSGAAGKTESRSPVAGGVGRGTKKSIANWPAPCRLPSAPTRHVSRSLTRPHYFRPTSVSVARPLSVSAYTLVSRLCSMGLHRMREDADCGVVDASRRTEQDHPVLCIELRRRLRHD